MLPQTINEEEAAALKIRIAERWVKITGWRTNAMSKALYHAGRTNETFFKLVQLKLDELDREIKATYGHQRTDGTGVQDR